MRIMGLDYGDRRIGIAVSDELGWTAQGIKVVEKRRDGGEIEEIASIINEYNVTEIIVGLPKNMNGTIGPRGEISQQFAQQLNEHFGLPVRLWDERLTTVAAERTLAETAMSLKKRKKVVDKMAAILILQNYLDSK